MARRSVKKWRSTLVACAAVLLAGGVAGALWGGGVVAALWSQTATVDPAQVHVSRVSAQFEAFGPGVTGTAVDARDMADNGPLRVAACPGTAPYSCAGFSYDYSLADAAIAALISADDQVEAHESYSVASGITITQESRGSSFPTYGWSWSGSSAPGLADTIAQNSTFTIAYVENQLDCAPGMTGQVGQFLVSDTASGQLAIPGVYSPEDASVQVEDEFLCVVQTYTPATYTNTGTATTVGPGGTVAHTSSWGAVISHKPTPHTVQPGTIIMSIASITT